jgi:quercetin dioxygenase-like cupin family protein
MMWMVGAEIDRHNIAVATNWEIAMSDIKVEHVSAAQVFEDDTFISRRLIRRDHGSEEMSFNVATLHENYNDQNCVYPEYDEIVYVLTGKAELTIDGETQTISEGTAFYVPRGIPYGYKVVEAPNNVVAVFTPAKK